MGQSQIAMLRPQRVGRDVPNNHRFAAVSSCPAGSGRWSNYIVIDRIGVGLGKLGAAPYRRRSPSSKEMDARTPLAWLSTSRQRLSRISASESPLATLSRIRLSTASRDSALELFDINTRFAPLHDLSLVILGRAAEEPPAKLAVRAPNPYFFFDRLFFSASRHPATIFEQSSDEPHLSAINR